MFLLRVLFAPVSLVIRTTLLALVAFAIVGNARRDASGETMLDRGIDQLKTTVLSIDSKELVRVSSGWYDWAKHQLQNPSTGDCPKTHRV